VVGDGGVVVLLGVGVGLGEKTQNKKVVQKKKKQTNQKTQKKKSQ